MFRSSIVVITEIMMFFHCWAFLLPSHLTHKSLSVGRIPVCPLISPHLTQDSVQTVVGAVSCFTSLPSLCPTYSRFCHENNLSKDQVFFFFFKLCLLLLCFTFEPPSTMFKISLPYKIKTQPCSY